MSRAYYDQYSILRSLLIHIGISVLVFFFSLTVLTAGLYTWATTVDTCKARSRYSLLSMIEDVAPFVARPIQQEICP